MFVFVPVKGEALGRYVQKKLSGLKIFEEPFLPMRENLRTGVSICEQWVAACEHLTGQVREKLIPTSRLKSFVYCFFKRNTINDKIMFDFIVILRCGKDMPHILGKEINTAHKPFTALQNG